MVAAVKDCIGQTGVTASKSVNRLDGVRAFSALVAGPVWMNNLSDFRHRLVDIETLGTLESTLVVPRFVRLSVVKPHHATALGALRVFPRTSDLRITHWARTRVVVTL